MAVASVCTVGHAVHAATINGDIPASSTSEDIAVEVTSNWDGQDFDCERNANTVQAFWDGQSGTRFAFDGSNACLGRSIYLTFVADNPTMPAHTFTLQLDCAAPGGELLASAQFRLDGNPLAYLTDGPNDFGDVSIIAMGLTTDSSGFADNTVPALTPVGTAIALGAAALLLGFVVLRRSI